MKKADLVAEVSERTGIPKREVSVVVNEFLLSLRRALTNGERIELRGFGVFSVQKRKSRVARNFRTNTKIRIPERRSVVFKVSKLLRKELEENDALRKKKKKKKD